MAGKISQEWIGNTFSLKPWDLLKSNNLLSLKMCWTFCCFVWKHISIKWVIIWQKKFQGLFFFFFRVLREQTLCLSVLFSSRTLTDSTWNSKDSIWHSTASVAIPRPERPTGLRSLENNYSFFWNHISLMESRWSKSFQAEMSECLFYDRNLCWLHHILLVAVSWTHVSGNPNVINN